jgi:hypothetical protein
MDDRVAAVRGQVAAGAVSPHALVLLFGAASEAEHANDVAALEEILEVARETARTAGEALRADAERLVDLCEQSLARARGQAETALGPAGGAASTCPDCGSEVADNALRCRRCGHRFF